MTAPIALFVYNRPWHLQQTLTALRQNELAADSELFIFADGPRQASHEDGFRQVRSVLKQRLAGFRRVTVVPRSENYGLARNIISGVTDIVEEYGEVIVLEDDMVTSPFFLQYMNEALAMYRECDEVISIHGYIYPVQQALPETFFLRGADCWGWATWRRGWALFEADGIKLLRELRERNLTREFDFGNTYPYTRMIVKQIAGENDSWAVRWYASAFLRNKLTLYPGHSLVHNIGNDGGGSHALATEKYTVNVWQQPIQLIPQAVQENAQARAMIEHFLRGVTMTWWRRTLRVVHRFRRHA